MPNAAAELRVARFRGDIERLIGAEGGTLGRFGVAVSGGPDSMALLWLTMQAFTGRVAAATVDHRLRADSRAEAEMVASWCREAGVSHAILAPVEPIAGNIQSAARDVRYALLREWCADSGIDWLLTAHHADDQLETMLMRLNRSSGVGGLAGIRARNGAILRPLLGWLRSELLDIVKSQTLPFVRDPSNEDSRFDRAAMRAHLAGVDWLDAVAASRSAAACADAEEALQWLVENLAATHIRMDHDGCVILDHHSFPRELQRRLILRMLALADPDIPAPRGDTIDQAVVQLSQGKSISIGRWLAKGGERWSLSPAPPRRGH